MPERLPANKIPAPPATILQPALGIQCGGLALLGVLPSTYHRRLHVRLIPPKRAFHAPPHGRTAPPTRRHRAHTQVPPPSLVQRAASHAALSKQASAHQFKAGRAQRKALTTTKGCLGARSHGVVGDQQVSQQATPTACTPCPRSVCMRTAPASTSGGAFVLAPLDARSPTTVGCRLMRWRRRR